MDSQYQKLNDRLWYWLFLFKKRRENRGDDKISKAIGECFEMLQPWLNMELYQKVGKKEYTRENVDFNSDLASMEAGTFIEDVNKRFYGDNDGLDQMRVVDDGDT